MDPLAQVLLISVAIVCAGIIATMIITVFVVNGRLANNNEKLERENASLRRELKRARDELNRRGVRLVSRLPHRSGW